MIPVQRVAVIYRKELLDILRDRRTLIAMIVIPVVLYPLLMLWLLWEAQAEQARLQQEVFIVEVADDAARQDLENIIAAARNPREPSASAPADELQPQFDIRVGHTPDERIGQDVPLRVELKRGVRPATRLGQLEIAIRYSDVDVRSRAARDELVSLLDEFRQLLTRESILRLLGGEHLPVASMPSADTDRQIDLILNPVRIETTSTASQRQRGGWALGQIIPILLVIMIVSGAIYPAVDLTAGERERGTLETLMVTPVPTVHLIVGKFLVVATIAMLTAALNLASVGATMHFGGISSVISAQMPIEFPLTVLPIILLCMVPLALLCSAVLVAVCSFARTFKEAQNYVVPVIIGSLVACVPVSMETARLEGTTLILPVGNMVLLARDMLQQNCTVSAAVVVLLSTTLYAAAAVAVAARLFGQEAVLFVDTGSFKNLFRRRLFKPVSRPTVAQAFLLVALIFPISFYGQAGLSAETADQFLRLLKGLAVWQFAGLFVLLPVAVCVYFRIGLRETFRLRLPPVRAWLAACLLGVSSWALAITFISGQHRLMPPSEAMTKAAEIIEGHINATPLPLALLLLAVIPAVCEEMLFRGYLLSGLSSSLRKWPSIFAAAAVFATFHFMIDRIPLTFLLGTVLAWLCWQSRSLLPGILFHVLHNGLMLAIPRSPGVARYLGRDAAAEASPLPPAVLWGAVLAFVAGLALIASMNRRASSPGSSSGS